MILYAFQKAILSFQWLRIVNWKIDNLHNGYQGLLSHFIKFWDNEATMLETSFPMRNINVCIKIRILFYILNPWYAYVAHKFVGIWHICET
jgi:hypothetical protein